MAGNIVSVTLIPKVDEAALAKARVNLEKPVTVVTISAIEAAESRMKKAAAAFADAMERAMERPTSVVLQKYARIAEAKLAHHTKSFNELVGPKAVGPGGGRVQAITDLFTKLSGNSASMVEQAKDMGTSAKSIGATLRTIVTGGAGGGAQAVATGGAGGGGGAGAVAGAGGMSKMAVAGGVAIAVVAAFGAVVGAVKYIHETMTKVADLAGIANPATLLRFNDALSDIWAVIGSRLIPVAEWWTEGLRAVGDVLQTTLPSAKEVRAVMVEYRPLLKEIKIAAAELAPVIKVALIYALKAAAHAVRFFVATLRELIDYLRKKLPGGNMIFGDPDNVKPLSSSFGASARGASYMGIEDIHKQAVIGALSTGRNLEQETADNTKRTADALEEMKRAGGARANVNTNLGVVGRLIPNALLAF